MYSEYCKNKILHKEKRFCKERLFSFEPKTIKIAKKI